MWIVIRYLSASSRLLRPLQFTWRHAGNPDSHVCEPRPLWLLRAWRRESFSSAWLGSEQRLHPVADGRLLQNCSAGSVPVKAQLPTGLTGLTGLTLLCSQLAVWLPGIPTCS